MKGRDEASEWYEVVRAGEILVWVRTNFYFGRIFVRFLFLLDRVGISSMDCVGDDTVLFASALLPTFIDCCFL